MNKLAIVPELCVHVRVYVCVRTVSDYFNSEQWNRFKYTEKQRGYIKAVQKTDCRFCVILFGALDIDF